MLFLFTSALHPGKIRYDLLWPLHIYLLALLGSILELESCEQQCVQSSRFKKEFRKDVCMLEKIAPSSFLLTLILDTVSMMLLLCLSHSYMTTTLAISGEISPPYSSLSHDINTIVLDMHPRTWMRLT